MADNPSKSSSSNTGLAFILGAVVVVVGALVYFYLGGDAPSDNKADITITVPDEIVPGNG